jgi:tRNA threonylcarbamoyladenosine biosynthesis protein TsaE
MPQTMDLIDLKSSEKWAMAFARSLKRPTVVLLDGDLGAGKTQFVRWMSEALGAKDASSPTFALHHRYDAADGAIDHFDLYRLKSDADLESTGFWDFLKEERALFFIEWGQRLPDSVWPEKWTVVKMRLDVVKEQARRLSVEIMRPETRPKAK